MTNTSIPYRRSGGTLEPAGKIWPDGQFTLGYAPCGGLERELTVSEWAAQSVAHLGLSIASNSHKTEGMFIEEYGCARDATGPGRGSNGITSYGRRLLSNAVSFLQRRHGRARLSFVTLTLPAVSYEESWLLSSCWSQVVRVFFQKLGRRQVKRGIPPHYASCTEIQPERCDREGHPALHLHFVMVGKARNEKGWAFTPTEVRELWRSVVEPYLTTECDWSAVENIQQVKRNAAAYLSKYLSKGGAMPPAPPPSGTGWGLPKTWYNISQKLRRHIVDSVRRSPELMALLEHAVKIGVTGGGFHYLTAGVIPEANTPGPHYYVGRLTGDFMRELLLMWSASRGM